MISGLVPALERVIRLPLRGSPRPGRRPADAPSRPIATPTPAHPSVAPTDSRRLDSALLSTSESVLSTQKLRVATEDAAHGGTIHGARMPPAAKQDIRLAHVALCEWMNAPKHRDPVFERDGWRCAVPACSSRCNLHDHHVKFQSEGGGDELENRITVCAGHHLHDIHAGLIHAEGRAPDAIRWKMPLATLVGDRYV